MLFIVRTEFQRPSEMDDMELVFLRGDEKRRATALQRAGVIRHLWREPDTSIAWGLWSADDEHSLLSELRSLPAFHWMTVSYREVIDHPNAIRTWDPNRSVS